VLLLCVGGQLCAKGFPPWAWPKVVRVDLRRMHCEQALLSMVRLLCGVRQDA